MAAISSIIVLGTDMYHYVILAVVCIDQKIENNWFECRCFFFFRQKTAAGMRISDWSSDVCSSDLVQDRLRLLAVTGAAGLPRSEERGHHAAVGQHASQAIGVVELLGDALRRMAVRGVFHPQLHANEGDADMGRAQSPKHPVEQIGRASCRERVCQTCRSRWSPYH